MNNSTTGTDLISSASSEVSREHHQDVCTETLKCADHVYTNKGETLLSE
jgi:hypothetical protein